MTLDHLETLVRSWMNGHSLNAPSVRVELTITRLSRVNNGVVGSIERFAVTKGIGCLQFKLGQLVQPASGINQGELFHLGRQSEGTDIKSQKMSLLVALKVEPDGVTCCSQVMKLFALIAGHFGRSADSIT